MLQQITDKSSLYKWFSMLPHLADDELDPYEYRLIGHYQRVCGENGGQCTEGVAKTAETCKMSTGMVSQTRQTLANKGWITVELVKEPTSNGKEQIVGSIVTLVDRWLDNFLRYSNPLHDMKTPPSQGEDPPSPHETKNNILESSDSIIDGEEQNHEKQLISSDDIKPAWQRKHPVGAERFYLRRRQNLPTVIIPVTVKAHTAKRITVEDDQGATYSNIKHTSLRVTRPQRDTSPLQDVILAHSWGYDESVYVDDRETLDTLAEMERRAPPELTPDELASIYQQAAPYWPKEVGKFMGMIKRYSGSPPTGKRDQSDFKPSFGLGETDRIYAQKLDQMLGATS